jgi:hypothetical protein
MSTDLDQDIRRSLDRWAGTVVAPERPPRSAIVARQRSMSRRRAGSAAVVVAITASASAIAVAQLPTRHDTPVTQGEESRPTLVPMVWGSALSEAVGEGGLVASPGEGWDPIRFDLMASDGSPGSTGSSVVRLAWSRPADRALLVLYVTPTPVPFGIGQDPASTPVGVRGQAGAYLGYPDGSETSETWGDETFEMGVEHAVQWEQGGRTWTVVAGRPPGTEHPAFPDVAELVESIDAMPVLPLDEWAVVAAAGAAALEARSGQSFRWSSTHGGEVFVIGPPVDG